MQEMRELARLLIKFMEIAREQGGLECELGMEEMLSRVHLPILRQAITELAAADLEKDKDDQEKKYGQKISMGNILTRTIRTMKAKTLRRWRTRRWQSSTDSTTHTSSDHMSCMPPLALELSPSR